MCSGQKRNISTSSACLRSGVASGLMVTWTTVLLLTGATGWERDFLGDLAERGDLLLAESGSEGWIASFGGGGGIQGFIRPVATALQTFTNSVVSLERNSKW